MRTAHHTLTKKNLAWMIWGLAATYFFCDYMARVSPGVMSLELQQAFSVSAAGLGLLSSFFYYPYIIMQIPVGLLVDRFSIRKLLTIMSLLTALGCYVFSVADSLWTASLGRMLIGFSAAFAFVSALRLAAIWFPPAQLGLLAGLTQALGMWGAAFGDAPVSYSLCHFGWRNTMFLMSAVFTFLSFLIYVFVQDRPSHAKMSMESKPVDGQNICASLKIVLSKKNIWLTALYVGFLFAPTAVFAEFWGPAYLQFARGLTAHQAAFTNSMIFIGWGIGGPLAGALSDRIGRRKPLLYFSGFAGLLLMLLIIYCPNLEQGWLMILCFLFGLTNIGVAVAYAVATELVPRHVVGTSIAFANMGSILIGAALQPVFGKVLEYTLGHEVVDISLLTHSDYSAAMLILPGCSLLALFFSFLIRETNCQPFEHYNSP